MRRAPICTSSPWCSGASRTRRPFTYTPLRLRSSAITGAPSRSSTSAWRRDTVVSSSTMSAVARRPMRVRPAEREDDDLVAVGDGEVASGSEPPDGGGGHADPVQERPGTHHRGRAVDRRRGRWREKVMAVMARSSFPVVPKFWIRSCRSEL